MNINILLIIGKSGVGKTTLADYLCKNLPNKYNLIDSITERPKRESNECGHLFVSKSKMDKILSNPNVVAYTKYGEYRYCAILQQFKFDKINVYVVDNQGVLDVKAYDWEGLDLQPNINVLKLLRDNVDVSRTRTDRDTIINENLIDFTVDNNKTIPLLAEEVNQWISN